MHVGETGQKRPAPALDDSRSGGDLYLGGGTDCGDSVARDQDGCILDGRAALAIDQPNVDDGGCWLEQEERA
jgi:hypothetical protein